METPDPKLLKKLGGKFIVFDGPDGCGKSTQRTLLGRTLADAGLEVVHAKDPGGTVIGDRIRHEILGHDLSMMDPRCETFLFMASRAQLVGEVIEPALRAHNVVLCDRFVSATCAYQGAAGYDIPKIIELARFAIGDTWPDLTIVIDIDVETGFERTGRRRHHAGKHRRKHAGQQTLFDDAQPDAMEARPIRFHRRVRKNFLTLPTVYPRPVQIVPAHEDPKQVQASVWEVLQSVDF